jgi:hypothetical protein
MKRISYLEELCVYGRNISKWILKKSDERV